MSESVDIPNMIARWRATIRGFNDGQLLAETQHQLTDSGWVSLKAHYMRELRDEIERRSLTNSDAYRTLMKRVIFMDRI